MVHVVTFPIAYTASPFGIGHVLNIYILDPNMSEQLIQHNIRW